MNEMVGGTEKLQLQHRLLSDDGRGFGLRFQTLFQNVLQAVDVEQVEIESPAAGRLQPSRTVAFGQAQQLLGLTQAAPGELAAQQLISEIASRRSEVTRPLTVVVGPALGVGSPALRVIGVIGGAAAGRLPLMRLDQLAASIDPNQRAIAADFDAATDPARGNRVEGLPEANVMVRMDFALRPGRAFRNARGWSALSRGFSSASKTSSGTCRVVP